MKTPALVFGVSSLFLALLASTVIASGDTNDVLRADAVAVSEVRLSVSSSQILQLTQAGMDESVITAFIDSSGSFRLSADQIVYLNDLGVPSHVIQAMLAHDRERLAASKEKTNAPNASVSIPQTVVATSAAIDSAISGTVLQVSQATVRDPAAESNNPAKPDVTLTQGSRPSQTVSPKRKVFFPVRAPYPVELTAPIVFLDPPTF